MEKFESELGVVKLTKHHFKRERSDSSLWDKVEKDSVVDKIHLTEIEGVRVHPENRIPYVEVETGEGEHRVYFDDPDTADRFYDRLDYFWKSSRQRED